MSKKTKNALAPIQQMLHSEKGRGQLALAIPPGLGLDPAQLGRVAMTSMARGSAKLIHACRSNPASFWQSMMEATQLGLTLDGPLGQAYLVPCKNKGEPYVKMEVGYKGYVALAVRGGSVSHVQTGLVLEGDHWEHEGGSAAFIRHIPHDKHEKRGLPTHVFAVAHLRDGVPPPFEVLTKADVDYYRDMSTSPGDTWEKHWGAMAKKTVIRRLCNGGHFPLSSGLSQALGYIEPKRMSFPATATLTEDPADDDNIDPTTGEILPQEEPPPPEPPYDDDGELPYGLSDAGEASRPKHEGRG